MTTSLKNIKTQIDTRLSGGNLDDLSCCQLQNAQSMLNNSVVTSVATTASLPSPSLNEGRFIYVEDINEYKFSDGGVWTDDLTTGSRIYQRQIWAWGNNICGQIGDGTTFPRCSPVREVSLSTDWCELSSGFSHNAAIKTSGQLWVWGCNSSYTSLGDGTNINRCSPVREISSSTNWCQVSAGRAHTSAIKNNGELWSWGAGNNRQIGDGTNESRCSPVREFCSATDWCQTSAGHTHNAAVKTSGQIWSWGANEYGQLGIGTATTRCSPVREFCSATDWCQVTATRQTIAIKTSGELWAWGQNNCGMIGDGTNTSRCSPVREISSSTDWCQASAGYFHSAAIKTSGQLWSWGVGCGVLANSTNQSFQPIREQSLSTNWCQVNAGRTHSAAIKTSGQLWSWGQAYCGQLAEGFTINRNSPVREQSLSSDWCEVSVGNQNSIAIKTLEKGFLE
jgi:alpha-tubulin suppressor-like RCC1 family protein